MILTKQEKINKLSQLCSNTLITPLSLMVQAGLLNKQIAKDILDVGKIEKLTKEISNDNN